jgi:hypothetical protein
MSLAVKQARFVARGDPGLFGSIGKFLGGVVKTVAGVGGALLPGPVGIGLRAISRIGAPQIQPPAPMARFLPAPMPIRGRAVAPPAALAGMVQAPGLGAIIACPPGFKANKSSYFLMDGSFIEKNTKCVRVRRRNPANSRATDRAIGRIESAKKMAARLGRIRITPACPGK